MSNWDEREHPRDNEGKFTYKNGGVSKIEKDENIWQRRADMLYPNMKDKKRMNILLLMGLVITKMKIYPEKTFYIRQ